MNEFAPDKKIQDTKIVVAMSGGVDSSVVASMLHKQGYQVIGVTMQLYDHGLALQKKGACCAGQDIYDAQMVANKIGFPHYVLDYESTFKEEVIDDFADTYLRGETPIPCVKCNQSVKFRDLFKMAKDLGADALATGHYVRRIKGKDRTELHKSIDESKDQSYFLFATTQEQLDYIHFPLGSVKKEDTRKMAQELGLEIANKPDSQDICFVPNGNYRSVVERMRPGALDDGDILHINGDKVGTHNGIINYTIGQRKGLGISWPTPLYVVKIDAKSNIVYVGDESDLGSKKFYIKDINWLIDNNGDEIDVSIKTRSTQSMVPATITPLKNNLAKVTLANPERAITPGQACVMYDKSRVIGGGWIQKED